MSPEEQLKNAEYHAHEAVTWMYEAIGNPAVPRDILARLRSIIVDLRKDWDRISFERNVWSSGGVRDVSEPLTESQKAAIAACALEQIQ